MLSTSLARVLRYILFALGVMGLGLTFGFFTQQSWALMLIPWEMNRLGAIFMASICAASAIPILWIAWTNELAALTGGGIDFTLMFAGFAGLSFVAYASNPRLPLLLFGAYCVAGLLVSAGMFVYGRRQTFRDRRPMPRVVRLSFGLFVVVLVLVGTSMVLKQPNIFPWTITPQQSVLYGWIFLGAATYFAYGLVRPLWGNAQGQLLGFFAYDVILIFPFVALLFGNEPFLLPNLLFYIVMLVYSGALAVYYVGIARATRLTSRAGSALPGTSLPDQASNSGAS